MTTLGSFVLKDDQRSPTGGRKNCPAGVGVVPFKAFRDRVRLRGVASLAADAASTSR